MSQKVQTEQSADSIFDDGSSFGEQFSSFGSTNSPSGFTSQSTAVNLQPDFDFVSATASVAGQMASAAASPGPVSPSPTSPTISAAPTSSTSSTPAWINSLATASIAADMKAADVSGVVTEAGLSKLFTDLDTTLTSTNSKLTAAEFADLKTIAANLNNGMSTSAYLTYITQALVDGNAANATWTGGNASATALGNLASGATATQLGELTGKWFLGTDLPSSNVSMDGANFSVSYSTSTKPLFASSGPSMNDINQGYLGDCYLLSSLAEVAHQDSNIISSMFTVNGNGTDGVKFYVNGAAEM
jgi:hypothetical protein